MSTISSHRIGNRASKETEFVSSSESSVLRSLFELRKTYTQQSENQHLTFWNCAWSARTVQSLRKILVRDERRFASIKFFDCAVQSDDESSQLFQQILRMVLEKNSTATLVIRGGRLVGDNTSEERCNCPSASLTNTLREGLSTNTSLQSLTLLGLDFSCPSAVEELSDALSRNTTLQSVNLRQSSLDDESIAQILRSIMEHPSLTSLNLSNNYLGARKSNAAFSSNMALDMVAELLQSKSNKLEHLNLSNQFQQHARESNSEQPIRHTEEEMQHQVLQHTAAFRKALEALSTNQSLKSIDLSNNPGCLSDDSSVQALAKCISANTCLKNAYVSNCGMTATSALALEKGLSSNLTLENLGDLPYDSENTYQRIQHLLNLNKAGRRVLCLSLPLANWCHLLARAGALEYNTSDQESKNESAAESVVFSLLRQGPILLEH